jgi:flagellar P-ring protein precursor FlgI
MSRRSSAVLALLVLVASGLAGLPTVRIKDIASIRGARANQLLGIGIVTGLSGKGDSPTLALTKSSVANLLSHFGIEVSAQDIKSKNCAIVTVSLEVPPFVRPGDRIDVTVASIQDARSLEGGVLLQTALQASNGQVYAVAQGRIVIPQANENVKTVGRIPSGAIVERDIQSQFLTGAIVQIVLRTPDFVTSSAVAKAIAGAFKDVIVTSRDAALIEVTMPADRASDPVGFIAELESITVTPDLPGKVVIDSSSGVIIIGDKVKIGKVLVSYKRMTVTVNPFGGGPQEKPDSFVINDTTTVDEFVATLKDVGLGTDAIIGILQAIEKAGALFGELVIM